MESSVSPASSLYVDIPKTESSVGETGWSSEHFDDASEFPRTSEKLDEENDPWSSTNLIEIGDRDKQPSEEFDEESDLKKPAGSKEITGEDNDYERSDVPKLPEDYAEETNKNKGEEAMLQAADDFNLAGMENTLPGNISAEVINGDFCEVKEDVHQSENSEGKAQEEEVQTAVDTELAESVENENSVMGVPIQDSEHELSEAKSLEPDEVADQKSAEYMASGSENVDEENFSKSWPKTESFSIDTESANYETESREGEVQTADDPERTESVENEDSVMGVPIQDSEHEPSVAKSLEPDEVTDQKSAESAEYMASGSENVDEEIFSKSWPKTESFSIDTESANYETESREGEVQIADDPEPTESVQNEDSVMGVPIQDSEHEPSVAKSLEPDEVADQKSAEYTASGSENVDEEDFSKSWPKTESVSIDTESDNCESEAREVEAKQFNVNSGITIEFSPESVSETSSFHLDPGQAGDDVRQIQESSQYVVLEPVSTPESDSLLALKNNEDLNSDSTEYASLTIPESDSSSIFRNGKDIIAESAEDAKFISTNTDESSNQLITSIVDNILDEPLGEQFHAGEAGYTVSVREKNLESEVINTEAVDEKNLESKVEGEDVFSAEEQGAGEEPTEMAENGHGLTAGKESNFLFSPEKLSQVAFEVDDPDIQEMEDKLQKISNAIECDQPSVVDKEDSSPAVESGAKNNGEDSEIVEPEPLNVSAGDRTYNDKTILVKNERSEVAASGNRDEESEIQIQIQDPENRKGTFLQRIWLCCGVLDWMRSSRD